VQTILYNLGYGLGSYGIDGDFGRATEAAVKEFQQDHGLNQDGVVGPLTYDALEKANKKPVTVSKSYSVLIPHLDKTQAEALRNNYPGSTITEE
jgi:peptidoglycan hydrolase-like protein with peptidoglycan-binding domain